MNVDEALLQGREVLDGQVLAEELKCLGEFSSGDMKTDILRILLESLCNWIRSMVWRDKDVAIHLDCLLRLVSSYSGIISHVNIDFILISPIGSIKLISCGFFFNLFNFFLI